MEPVKPIPDRDTILRERAGRLVQIVETSRLEKREFARRMGCTPAVLSQLLYGRKPITDKTAEDIGRAFKLSPCFILYGD